MIIRKETSEDIAKIRSLTARAFALVPFSNGSEPAIIDALREHKQLTLSLVAEEHGVIVGQITFSPVTIDGDHDQWFGLGPISVEPSRQGQKIGSWLIYAGLEQLKANGAKGCVLVGDPNYYGRFGFIGNTDLIYGDSGRRYVQKLEFIPSTKNGILKYCKAFEEAATNI